MFIIGTLRVVDARRVAAPPVQLRVAVGTGALRFGRENQSEQLFSSSYLVCDRHSGLFSTCLGPHHALIVIGDACSRESSKAYFGRDWIASSVRNLGM